LIERLAGLLNFLPHGLTILIAAALPIIEVRGSVPLGILYFKMAALKVVLLSVVGGVLPVFPILWFLFNLTEKARKLKFLDKFFEWLFEHTRAKSGLVERFELLGLTIFMALPVPGAGIWTGCMIAYLLELPWIPTFICAVIATTIASLLVLAASLGLVRLF
jgi:uncharacterized membrane protein